MKVRRDIRAVALSDRGLSKKPPRLPNFQRGKGNRDFKGLKIKVNYFCRAHVGAIPCLVDKFFFGSHKSLNLPGAPLDQLVFARRSPRVCLVTSNLLRPINFVYLHTIVYSWNMWGLHAVSLDVHVFGGRICLAEHTVLQSGAALQSSNWISFYLFTEREETAFWFTEKLPLVLQYLSWILVAWLLNQYRMT